MPVNAMFRTSIPRLVERAGVRLRLMVSIPPVTPNPIWKLRLEFVPSKSLMSLNSVLRPMRLISPMSAANYSLRVLRSASLTVPLLA